MQASGCCSVPGYHHISLPTLSKRLSLLQVWWGPASLGRYLEATSKLDCRLDATISNSRLFGMDRIDMTNYGRCLVRRSAASDDFQLQSHREKPRLMLVASKPPRTGSDLDFTTSPRLHDWAGHGYVRCFYIDYRSSCSLSSMSLTVMVLRPMAISMT